MRSSASAWLVWLSYSHSLNLPGDEQSSTSIDFHFARLPRSLEFAHCLTPGTADQMLLPRQTMPPFDRNQKLAVSDYDQGSRDGILKGWKSISPGLSRHAGSYPGVKQCTPATLKGLNQRPVATAKCVHPGLMLSMFLAIFSASCRGAGMEYLTNEWSLVTGAPTETC